MSPRSTTIQLQLSRLFLHNSSRLNGPRLVPLTMKKLPISVCMVSGAEAHRIGRALESVADWASEIIVVLNEEVADGTDALAARFGAKIFREPWRGFIAQKNSAAEKATQPWLLNLDADEVVSPELQREIAATVQGEENPLAACEFPRCTFYCGRWIRHGDWYPDRVLRLWRRGTARWLAKNRTPSFKSTAWWDTCARTCCISATKASPARSPRSRLTTPIL